MGKKLDLLAVLGTVLFGTGLTVMLTTHLRTLAFYLGAGMTFSGILLTIPVFREKSKTEKFQVWLKEKIKQGEKIYNSKNMPDEAPKTLEVNEALKITKDFDYEYNKWYVKYWKVLRQAFGKESSFCTINPEMEKSYINYLNGPAVWGGFRKQLFAEIQHLKWLQNMIKTSEYFRKNFDIEIIKEIEKMNYKKDGT